MTEQADAHFQRPSRARRFAKNQKNKTKRRLWKNALRSDELPKSATAYEGRYNGWMT